MGLMDSLPGDYRLHLTEEQVAFIGEVWAGATATESDPAGKDPHSPGAKMDAGKAPIFRGLVDYFPLAISAVAEVSQKGADKYAWKGWESVPEGFERYSDALMRHLCVESFEDIDKDTGCLHAAQVAWNALARLELKLREGEENADDPAR